VAAAHYIQDHLEGIVEFTEPDQAGNDFILAIQGCEVACADLSEYDDIPVRLINSWEDARKFVAEMLENQIDGSTIP